MKLLDWFEDPESSEEQLEMIIEELERVEEDFTSKAENYVKLIKNIETPLPAIDEEIIRLSNRKKTIKNRSERIKQSLYQAMKVTGQIKIDSNLFKIAIQKNGGKRALTLLVDSVEIPKEFQIEQPPKPDNNAIREYLGNLGVEECGFARLEPQGESLRIK